MSCLCFCFCFCFPLVAPFCIYFVVTYAYAPSIELRHGNKPYANIDIQKKKNKTPAILLSLSIAVPCTALLPSVAPDTEVDQIPSPTPSP